MTDNLTLWKQLENTDPDFCRQFDNRRYKGTSADPTWVKRLCTTIWGPYGANWGLKDCKYGYHTIDGATHCWLEAVFFWPGGQFDISSDVAWNKGHECRKRVHTDTLKKALSHLGCMADIYMGAFDNDPHVENPALAAAEERATKTDQIIEEIGKAESFETLNKYMDAAKRRNLSRFHLDKVDDAYSARKAELMELQAQEAFQ